jgi:hypothetical protein
LALAKRTALRQSNELRKAFRAVKAAGVPVVDVLDQRSTLGLAFRRMTDELSADLGGAANLSSQKRMLIEQVVRLRIILDAWDLELFQARLDPKDADCRKQIIDRNKLAYLLSQLVGQLGLDRVAAPVESPLEILRAELEGDGEGA